MKLSIIAGTFVSAFLLSVAGAVLQGCTVSSDDTGPVLDYDCQAICERYADCYDANYDTVACTDRCDSNSGAPSFDDRAYDCQVCLDDHSCAGSFVCQDSCSGIVP